MGVSNRTVNVCATYAEWSIVSAACSKAAKDVAANDVAAKDKSIEGVLHKSLNEDLDTVDSEKRGCQSSGHDLIAACWCPPSPCMAQTMFTELTSEGELARTR